MEVRERLLADTLEYVARHGIGEVSLRQLAAALGTSHRMLIYHFGSKEGLLAEVVKEVERRQRSLFAADDLELYPGPGSGAVPEGENEHGNGGGSGGGAGDGLVDSPADLMRRMWARVSDPALWPYERLFFEMYSRALQEQPGTPLRDGFLDGIVESWLQAAEEMARRHRIPIEVARLHARLGVAVVRGLLLDLLATGDRAGVTAAMEHFIAAYEGDWTTWPTPAGQAAPEREPGGETG